MTEMTLLLMKLLFLVIITIVLGTAENTRIKRQALKCDDCVLLGQCPSLLESLRSNDPNARNLIRKNRCGREGIKAKVCCPRDAGGPVLTHKVFPFTCGNPVTATQETSTDMAAMGEFPWIVALGYQKPGDKEVAFMCSGSLINDRYVLTAAHCLDEKRLRSYELTVVRLREYDLNNEKDCIRSEKGELCSPPHIDLSAEETTMHPMYDDEVVLANDIALIRLNQTIDFLQFKGWVAPVCLPSAGVSARYVAKERKPLMIGWGMEKIDSFSNPLRKISIPFANRSLCSKFYYDAFGDRQICAGGYGMDACQGDSGSPLMLAGPRGPPYLQIGIVSFGKDVCGIPGIPSVYTSISPYIAWIASNVKRW